MPHTSERSLQVIFSASLAALTSYLGVIAIPVIILTAAMITDYITGMISAWHNSELSSKKGIFGIIKKISYLALVCVGMGVDWLIYSGLNQAGISTENSVFFGVLVTIWLIINELISILENLKNIGVPLPAFLVTIIKKLKVSAEYIKSDNDTDKKQSKGENDKNE